MSQVGNHSSSRDIGFYADDGLDTLSDGCVIELNHTVHHTVVGESNTGHAEFLGAFDERRYFTEAIEQGICLNEHEGEQKI